jgi:mono/diheme cytochrome c family protein
MTVRPNSAVPAALVLFLGLGQAACSPKAPANKTAGSAQLELASVSQASTSPATSPVTPTSTPAPRDTPPPGEAKPTTPAGAGDGAGAKVSKLEYDGWRQYSVHCARCHGQDVLPNPVAANLLLSLGPGGPIKSEQMLAEVVTAGRVAKGMPAFKATLTPDQIKAIYAYVKGRAEKRIPPGRPANPA